MSIVTNSITGVIWDTPKIIPDSDQREFQFRSAGKRRAL